MLTNIPTIPNYTDLQLIKSGPEADTFSVKDSDVIIKVFYFTDDQYDNDTIHRTCHISQHLSDNAYPYVPLIHQIYSNDSFMALIMESIKSITLTEFITNNKKELDQSNAAKIILSLLLAIDSIHKAGFCHYDLHGDNVLIDPDFNIKIIDFSCSDDISALDPSDGITPMINIDYLNIKCHIARLIFASLPALCIEDIIKLIRTYTEKDVIGYDINPDIASSLFHILDPFANIC